MAGIQIMPSFFDEIKPGLQQIGALIADLRNPHAKQEAELRRRLAADPTMAQQLIDMGPEAVTKIYGKNATKYYNPNAPKSASKITDDILRERLVAMGKDPTFIEEFFASKTGTKTPTERTIQQNTITRQGQEITQGAQQIDLNNLHLATSKLMLEDKRQQAERDTSANLLFVDVQKRGVSDLYQALQAKKITPQELAVLRGNERFNKQYEDDRQNYWRAQRQALDEAQYRLSAARGSTQATINDYIQKRQATVAADIAEQYGVDVQPVIVALSNPDEYNKYVGKDPNAAKTPVEKTMILAANAVKERREQTGEREQRIANMNFSRLIQSDMALIRNPRIPPSDKLAAVDRINGHAIAQFGMLTDKPLIIAYDKEGKHSKRAWLKDLPEIRVVQGDPKFGFAGGEGEATATQTKIDTNSPKFKALNPNDQKWLTATPDQRAANLKKLKPAERNKAIAFLSSWGITE